MERINVRLANWTLAVILLLGTGYLLILGKALILPVIFAIMFSFLLYPLCKKLESWGFNRILAILSAMFSMVLGLLAILGIFSSQFVNLFADFSAFKEKVIATFYQSIDLLNSIPWINENFESIVKEGGVKAIQSVQGIVTSTLSSSTLFIGYLGMMVIYLFFFLLYRTNFKNFIINQYKGDQQSKIEQMLYRFQKVIQSYFVGLLLSILVIGTINSIGLMIIGIDYAFLFGFFAAFLTIIPYVGTTIGGTLPFLYALINYDSYWYAVAVVIMYQVVQILEGNFITPKIVGSQVSINPLIALFVLLFGAFFWGIAGMVLAIPLTALLKITLEYNEKTASIAHLLSSDFYSVQKRKKTRTKVKP